MALAIYLAMTLFVAIAVLSFIAAGWFDGWRDFLERL